MKARAIRTIEIGEQKIFAGTFLEAMSDKEIEQLVKDGFAAYLVEENSPNKKARRGQGKDEVDK